MNYIFVVNDIDFIKFKLEELIKLLFGKKVWIYTPHTPNIKKLNIGDKVILYAAGKERKYFVGTFQIAGEIQPNEMVPSSDKEKVLFNIFNLATPIADINLWEHPLSIYKLKDKLSFITDSKNYGLFFRQATKAISAEDYNLITRWKGEDYG